MGAKKGVAVRFANGCSAVYAVTAGTVFEVNQAASIPFAPLPVPPPAPAVRDRVSSRLTSCGRCVAARHVTLERLPHCQAPPAQAAGGRAAWDALSDAGKGGVIAVIVIVSIVICGLVGFLSFMYVRERRGAPVFTKLDEVRCGWGIA